jgi:PAS domain S-box-containing protein
MQNPDDPQLAETVLGLVNDAIIAIDDQERITYLNPAAERQYGRSAPEVVGKPLRELFEYRWIGPHDEAAAAATLRAAGVWRGENIHIRRDGVRCHVESVVTARTDQEGRVVGAIATIRDIGAQRQSEARLQLLIESVTDYAIFTMDLDGNIDSWNTGARRIFGYAASQILGKSAAVLFTAEDQARGAHLHEMQSAREDGCAEDERYHVRSDNSRFFASGVLSPLRDPSGDLQGYVKIARDLTARRQWEMDLQRAHDLLEAKVAERTQALEEANRTLTKELRDRQEAEQRVRQLWWKLIAAQEEERRRIARDLHDHLGQQMTALQLQVAALGRTGPDDPVWQQRFHDTQAYLNQLDRDLDFFTWELRPAAIYDLGLAPALTDYVTAFAKNYEIPVNLEVVSVPPKRLVPEIEINLYRIAQEALNNVYKHAKATAVDVFLQQRDERIVLSVIDNGRGFDPHVAADGVRDRGLGLLGMRERANLVGGAVQIETGTQGTAVIVSVPAAVLQADERQSDSHP